MCDSTLLLNIVLFKYCIFFPSGFQQLADACAQMQALQLQNSELFHCTNWIILFVELSAYLQGMQKSLWNYRTFEDFFLSVPFSLVPH